MESQAPCKFFDLLTSAHSEASKETQIQRERAAAAERAFRQAAAAAEADAALARELDAAFMAEERATEERRLWQFEQDSKLAAELLEAEKVLLERQAGDELKDKAFAKKLQVKESKELRDKIDAVLRFWHAPNISYGNTPRGAMITCKLPLASRLHTRIDRALQTLTVVVEPDFAAVDRFASELPRDMLPKQVSLHLDMRITGIANVQEDSIETSFDETSQEVKVLIPGGFIHSEDEEKGFMDKIRKYFKV